MDSDLTKKLPLVSVVMSVYNCEKYVGEAIESILHQSFVDFEFLIIDDGSFDNTFSILDSYKDERIKLITNSKNRGLVTSLNSIIKIATGKYIARMDADDISVNNRLERQVEFLEKNNDIGVVGSWVQIVDQNGFKGKVLKRSDNHLLLRWGTFFEPQFTHAAVMFHRKQILEIGGYPMFNLAQDYGLWAQLNFSTYFSNVQEVLLYYRDHEANISHKKRFEQQQTAKHISNQLILSYLEDDLPLIFSQIFLNNHIKSRKRNTEISKWTLFQLFNKFYKEYSYDENSIHLIKKDFLRRFNNMSINDICPCSKIFNFFFNIYFHLRQKFKKL